MRINSKQKELIKVFAFLFFLAFIIMNWDSVSWIFNYRELSGLAYDFFNPYQDEAVSVSAYTVPTPTIPVISNSVAEQTVQASVNYDLGSSLVIPAINVNTPVIFSASTDVPSLEKDLDKGAVFYPGSVLPGQSGQMLVLGHSAPVNWPHIKHDYIFSDLEKLSVGDSITLYFNGQAYVYEVKEKKIIDQGQEVTYDRSLSPDNALTLVSCWPPGKNYKRIAVTATLVRH
jgi:LPXTG-site transpeptidase (sortase) family protein